MNKNLYLLDTSAILTFFEDEDGSNKVEEILKKGPILIPAIVLLEVYYTNRRRKGVEIAEQRYALCKGIKARHENVLPEPILLKAGEFKADYAISLADAVIAGYAFVHNATLVHKDPEYEVLTMIDQIQLPYKPSGSQAFHEKQEESG